MTRDEIEAYLTKWYGRDPANPGGPSRIRGVAHDVVDGCSGYSLMLTDSKGAPCVAFVPEDVSESQLDDVVMRAQA